MAKGSIHRQRDSLAMMRGSNWTKSLFASAIVQRGNRVPHKATDLLHFSELHELPSANMAAIQKKSTRSLFEIGLAADVLLDDFGGKSWNVQRNIPKRETYLREFQRQ